MAFRHILSSASALALFSTAALADVTASDVWTDMQDLIERYGATIESASVDEGSGSVTVNRMVINFALPEDGSMSMDMGDLSFTETGDGRVRVEMAETIPVDMQFTSPEGDGAISMTLTQSGLEVLVSEDGDATRYDSTADTLGISDVVIDDPSAEEDFDFDVDVTMNDLSAFSAISGDDLMRIVSESRAANIAATITGSGTDDDGEPADVNMRFEMSDYFADSDATFTSLDTEESLANLIAEGFDVSGKVTFAAGAYDVAGSGPDGPFAMTGTSQNASLGVAIGEAGLTYDVSSGPDSFQITGGDVPFPLSFSVDESAGRFSMPVVPSDEPQGFALVTRMVGLTIDETLWNMFDPSEQVIRDPATVVIDLSGEAILAEDIFDPEYAENATGAPGSVEGLALNELRLEVAGAKLTGTGDLEFNNAGMMPMPYGTIDLMLTGGNRLIDTAVNLGFVPEQQAMGARMMLGLFARPGEGEDSLVSTIELKEDGSVLANGQRIR